VKTVLALELIADELFLASKHGGLSFHEWLRFMMRLGPDKSQSSVVGLGRSGNKIIRCYKDYDTADRTGNRGVIGHFALDPGVYQVTERIEWDTVKRYFVLVENGEIRHISQREAQEWQKDI